MERHPRLRPAVLRLKRIVDATGAFIVVSSTWRIYHYDSLCDYLGKAGLCPLGATAVLANESRGEEIQFWLDLMAWPPESFIIIDDDSDMGHLLPRLVKTTFQFGLLDEHVEQAINMLKGEQ